MPRSYRHIQEYEKEISELKEKGYTNREIGEKLGFSKEQIKEKSISDLGNMFCRTNSYLLKEKKKYITLLLHEDYIIDTQLAKTFGIEIDILRKELLDLFPEIIEIHYVDLESTKISINSELKQLIINYYQELENEE